jgi:hypothetical protein
VLDRFTGAPPGPTPLLAEALGLAEDRRTNRLGHLLAPMGVRYLVIPTQLAPSATSPDDRRPVPSSLTDTLAQQLDLQEVPVRDGLLVYRNTAWVSQRAVLPPRDGDRTSFTDAVGDDLRGGLAAMTRDRGPVGARGDVPAEGDLLVATASDPGWELRIDGIPMGRSETYGWANQFAATRAGTAALTYDTPVVRRLAAGGQVALWVAVLVVYRRTRVAERRRAALPPVGSA